MNPLQSARSELEALKKLKQDVERKIKAVQQSIKLLEPVYENQAETSVMVELTDNLAELGMTEAVFNVLKARPNELLTPTKVRDALVAGGHALAGSNPMATIHTVLKRLAVNKPRIKDFPLDSGGKAYCYATADEVVRTGSWHVAPVVR